eukprot:COSAG05_NODE_4292_length_1579_cov_1.325676_1_plen_279_part_10
MLTHGNRLILFGGFSDFVRESKYYNDLFVFDIDTVMWSEVKYGASGAMRPQPRSGFQWLMLPDGVSISGGGGSSSSNKALLFGGYCKQMKHKKLYDSSKSAGGKSEKADAAESENGITYTDSWWFDLETLKWDQARIKGNAPTPRCGFNIALWKKTVVVFGGVYDEDEGELLKSTFYDELFAISLERLTWFPLNVTVAPRGADKTSAAKRAGVKVNLIEDAGASAGGEAEGGVGSDGDADAALAATQAPAEPTDEQAPTASTTAPEAPPPETATDAKVT